MKAGSHHTDVAKLDRIRETDREWRKNYSAVNVLSRERKAAREALPARMRPASRQCLDCREMFDSASCGNRRCADCVRRMPS